MTAEEISENDQAKDEKREKEKKKKNAFSSKIVVRRLPWSMTETEFLDCVSPLPEHDYFRFVKADFSFDRDASTRAYINFVHQDDIFTFQQQFDGYVFLDSKGNECPALVEFAPNQKIPSGGKEGRSRKDLKVNTIEDDPDYLKFLDILQGNVECEQMPSVEQVLEEIEARERETKAGRGIDKQTTPLLQFMKEKKEEKIKKKEEMKENRRRKDEERKKKIEDERQRRKELKDKEIRDRDKKEKDRKEDRKEKRKEEKDSDDEWDQRFKKKQEQERLKKREREEREKERFRKKEEERLKRREEKREKYRLEKEAKLKEEKESKKDGELEKEEEKESMQEERQSKESSVAPPSEEKKPPETPSPSIEAPPAEIAETLNESASKTKRYSDKRKEDRLKRERERQEKLKKKTEIPEEGNDKVGTNTTTTTTTSSPATEASSSKPSAEPDVVEIVDEGEQDLVRTEEQIERAKQRERERAERREREREERAERRRERDLKAKRNKERPDMQIYRPGMGKFSSRTIKKESPKSSPEESRETSPAKKSPERRRDKKYPKDDSKKKDGEPAKRHNTREYVNKTWNSRREEAKRKERKGGTDKKDITPDEARSDTERQSHSEPSTPLDDSKTVDAEN